MRFNRMLDRRLFEPADPGEGGGGSGGGDDGGDPNKGKPTDKEAELLKEVMKKKKALDTATANLATLQANFTELETKLKSFEGIDPDQVRKLLDEKKAAETLEMEKRGEFDRIRAQMVKEHEDALARLKGEYDPKLTELSSVVKKQADTITELTIGRAFGDSNFVREDLNMTPAKARLVYAPHFESKDGKIIAYDKPAGASERTMLVDGKGEPLAFEDAMRKIVEADPDRDHLLKSKLRQGASSRSDRGGGKATPEVGSGRDRIAATIAAGKFKLPS